MGGWLRSRTSLAGAAFHDTDQPVHAVVSNRVVVCPRWRSGLLSDSCLETEVRHNGWQLAQSDWDEPFPPHRIADNLYYVGSKGLATYLVTTTNGHILINSSFERTLPIIRGGVEKLGFRFADIKILLASHAHSDHVAGHALIKELTGARVAVMEGDANVISSGGKGQYLYREAWKPCAVDRVLKDGDTVTLGEAK